MYLVGFIIGGITPGYAPVLGTLLIKAILIKKSTIY